MSFNIGDRVRPISDRDFSDFGEGTIVAEYSPGGYYINWDHPNGSTYHNSFKGNNNTRENYTNVYMMFYETIELLSDAIDRPPLPTDPRLRGICLKIRQLDKKFKDRQEHKAKSNNDDVCDVATYYATTVPSGTGGTTTIYRDGTTRPTTSDYSF